MPRTSPFGSFYVLTCVYRIFCAVTDGSHSSAGQKRPSFEDDEPDGGIIVEQPKPRDRNILRTSLKPNEEDSSESDSQSFMHCVCDSLTRGVETTMMMATSLMATSCTDLQMMIKPEYYAVAESDILQVRTQSLNVVYFLVFYFSFPFICGV